MCSLLREKNKTLPVFTWLIWFLIQILKVYCLRTENTSSIHKLHVNEVGNGAWLAKGILHFLRKKGANRSSSTNKRIEFWTFQCQNKNPALNSALRWRNAEALLVFCLQL